MANLLQKVALWLGCAPALLAAPFSHRLHLQLKLDCVTCHTTAPSSTRVEDNNLPAKTACVRCHSDVTIKQPAPTRVTVFSHQQHLKLGNIAPVLRAAIDSKTYLSPPGGARRHLTGSNPCMACHRGLEESDQTSKAVFPQMADCLVCHTKIDPPNSCAYCHAGDTKLRPESHTLVFADRHSSKTVDKSDCAVCHGRQFTCMGCH